jgi:putative transposase
VCYESGKHGSEWEGEDGNIFSRPYLCYRNEIVFTDCGMRSYWDEQHSLMVDRDVNAAVNLKRLGLGIFPSIKRRSGNLSIVGTIDDSTAKEILHTLHRAAKMPTS